MTLLDLLEKIPRFISRHPFPVYVEISGELLEVDGVDFKNGCTGTVLKVEKQNSDEWWEELYELRETINQAWSAVEHPSEASRLFDPAAEVIAPETAYRLILMVEELLDKIHE